MLAPEEFDRAQTAGYLDTATYGLPPARTLAALSEAVEAWRGRESWHRWEEDGEACRDLFARIAGARPAEIALLPAVSAAAGIVAASLGAGPGDNVVCYEDDFESVLFPFLALETRGVDVRLRPLAGLAEAVDARTQLVAVSTVQSAGGQVADLPALRDTGAALFLDATQSAGALPVSLEGVDFLAAASYKWLLCPRGMAFLYVRPERLPEIEPWLAGWKAADTVYERYYGAPRSLAADTRRLDVSLPWLLTGGTRASLELISELGIERIAAHDLELARRFCRGLGIPEPASPIVRLDVEESDSAVAALERAGIRCAARRGAVRLSFHLYNDERDVDLALDALEPARGRPAEGSV